MRAAFFHQNAPEGRQGGIERYIATLRNAAPGGAVLICGPGPQDAQRFVLPLGGIGPLWLRFVCAVWRHALALRAFLRSQGVTAIEFSRPEYALFSFLFAGKKRFTLHGTGPARQERLKYLIHTAACCLLPLLADEVCIIGRDPRALPGWVHRLIKPRLHFLDAWYDPCFQPTPWRDPTQPLHLFYAGRLDPMKNPDLLFALIRHLHATRGNACRFSYFGADGALIPPDLRAILHDGGLRDAPNLARAIASCDLGLLCSGFGEGSPFIVVETLACGRGFILPPLPGLRETYQGTPGVFFAARYDTDAYTQAIDSFIAARRAGTLTPERIADAVAARSQETAARQAILSLLL